MESDSNENSIDINGVLNIIRLEGVIGKIKKVYYFYITYNTSVSSQLQCDNVFSVDIEKHFADTILSLQNSEKTYDFYIENIDNFLVSETTIDKKQTYSAEIKKFFIKILDDHKDSYSLSSVFKNIKCHYLDTKEYYLKNDIMNYVSNIDLLFQYIRVSQLHIETLNQIVNCLTNLKNKLTNLFLEKIMVNDKMFNKLYHKYVNLDVHDVANNLLREFEKQCKECVIDINDCIHLIIDCSAIYDSLMDPILRKGSNNLWLYTSDRRKINEYCYKILETTLKISCKLENIQTILETTILNRQFNDSINTNIIIVANSDLVAHLTEIMIKKYKFKVTNNSLCDDNEDLNKNLNLNDKSLYNKYLLPEILSQCSKITGFPEKFS